MAIADFCASPVSSFVIYLYILVLPFYVHLLGCMPISAHSGLFKAGALFIHLYIPPGPGQGLSQRTCSVNVPFVQSKKIYCRKCLMIISSIITRPTMLLVSLI